MLLIDVPAREIYDESVNEFRMVGAITLRLEHSLVSISKWEAKWKKPFLTKDGHSREELIDYIRCMTLNQHVPDDVYYCLTKSNIDAIAEYINDQMTATTITKRPGAPFSRRVITSELIYYWMTAFNIPMECQKWHLSRLMTLIEVCSVESAPKKKMPMNEVYSRNRALNAARRKKYNTRG